MRDGGGEHWLQSGWSGAQPVVGVSASVNLPLHHNVHSALMAPANSVTRVVPEKGLNGCG